MLQLTLPGLLPSGCLIAFNRDLGTLILLAMDGNETGLLNEQQFMPSDMCVLVPLMCVYPYFCPHELLLASFNNVRDDASDSMIERYRASLLEVFETPVWDVEMRPVRNALSRVRPNCIPSTWTLCPSWKRANCYEDDDHAAMLRRALPVRLKLLIAQCCDVGRAEPALCHGCEPTLLTLFCLYERRLSMMRDRDEDATSQYLHEMHSSRFLSA